jgi:PAS domain-containing protein
LPSLILRLERLAQPEEALEPDATPAADVAREPEPEPRRASTLAAHPSGEALRPADTRTAAHGIGTARRVVDLTGQERLSTPSSLSRWSAAVAAAQDACFILDRDGRVISISVAAIELIGYREAAVIGRHILEVVNLVDLESGGPRPEYAPRIPPLVVLNGPGLARSITRVRHEDDAIVTLDTSSAPIHDANGQVVGSISFLAPIPAR